MTDDNSTVSVPARAWIFPTLIHGILVLTVFARLLVGGTRYEQVFREYGLALPATTESFLALSTSVRSNFFPAIIVLPALWALDALVLWLMGGWSRFEGQVWFWVVVVILLLTWGVMEVSYFLPYFKLREALGR